VIALHAQHLIWARESALPHVARLEAHQPGEADARLRHHGIADGRVFRLVTDIDGKVRIELIPSVAQ
jgi:hypothetical protein